MPIGREKTLQATHGLVFPDRPPGVLLQAWLFAALRDGIISGRLSVGLRLPASRTLAAQYGISRGTVSTVYEQLAAEGYVGAVVGRGTHVADVLPERLLRPSHARLKTAKAGSEALDWPAKSGQVRSSRAAAAFSDTPFPLDESSLVPRPFRAHLPDLRLFPVSLWGKLAARHARRIGPSDLSSPSSAGLPRLREAIAMHLRLSRGVQVDAARILVVSSAQQGLDLCLRLLTEPGDTVWLEDPGYPGARRLMQAHALGIVDVPVDQAGVQVHQGVYLAPQARLAYVTPSRQAPLGVPLSAQRRMALLAWAAQAGAFIVEDDYDSEYRYKGRPIAALKGQDRDDRVILLGTFSKLLFPSLRLAYVVLPDSLADRFLRAHSLVARGLPRLEQNVHG